jgi:hypothetical protein
MRQSPVKEKPVTADGLERYRMAYARVVLEHQHNKGQYKIDQYARGLTRNWEISPK